MLPNYRIALEKLYTDTCTIKTYQSIKDNVTKRTAFTETVEHSEVPCRLSYSSTAQTEEGEAAQARQNIKLFMSSDIAVAAGSTMTVTHDNVTTTYTASGEPAVYKYHQEIDLELKRWT